MTKKRGAPFGNKNAAGGFKRGFVGSILGGAPGAFSAGAITSIKKGNQTAANETAKGAAVAGGLIAATISGALGKSFYDLSTSDGASASTKEDMKNSLIGIGVGATALSAGSNYAAARLGYKLAKGKKK